jgi:hypothetical protein
MTRAYQISAYVAMGLLMAGSTAMAQTAPASTSGGQITIQGQGVGNVASSKFTEYREVPRGISMPSFSLFSKSANLDFNLYGYNVRQTDQRYTGWLNTSGIGLKFDYNEIPHNMGNGAHAIFNETTPGVWTVSSTLAQSLESAILKTASAGRTYNFYNALLTPTMTDTHQFDVSGLRKTSNVEFNLGEKLPFELTLTYRNEVKTGYRGLSGGNWRATLSPVYEVAAPLNENINDFGLRAEYKFNGGNIYATANRNTYNNRAETLTIDNLLQWNDSSTGYAHNQIVMAPDNQASTGKIGFQLKTKLQTRFSGSYQLQRRTQDAPFYTYTLDSLTLTTAGVKASSLAALPQSSFGGKIDTKMMNFAFSSRPIEGLSLRAQYRKYDLTDKSHRFTSTGDMSTGGITWDNPAVDDDDPQGRATANDYSTKSYRFNGSASYDIGPVTVEGQVRSSKIDRMHREALSGKETGYAGTLLFRANDLVNFRGTYDQSKRTADGTSLYGFQMDEAPFTNKRTGIDIDLTPMSGLDLSFGYMRRDVDYTGRPNRIAVTNNAPTPGAVAIPNSPSGLLSAKYDSWTGEINYSLNTRIEVGAYYTQEKDATTNEWSTTTGLVLNNLLKYAGLDKTSTFGANAVFQLVPDKQTLTLNASSQKVNGLMDITANETGSFYNPGRTTLIPAGQGGAADINDWDDTKLTTLSAQYDYTVNRAWKLTAGYQYEKYDFGDAYNDPANTSLMPATLIFLMKPNWGNYKANMVYGRVSYTF